MRGNYYSKWTILPTIVEPRCTQISPSITFPQDKGWVFILKVQEVNKNPLKIELSIGYCRLDCITTSCWAGLSDTVSITKKGKTNEITRNLLRNKLIVYQMVFIDKAHSSEHSIHSIRSNLNRGLRFCAFPARMTLLFVHFFIRYPRKQNSESRVRYAAL